jgi:predicted TIM-barrel fold metal-dependent hydrolase
MIGEEFGPMSAMPGPQQRCDCHVHVVDPQAQYPMVLDRSYTPGEASHEQLLAHMARVGLGRVVIVQPSFYGTDNRCMLDSLRRLQGAGRGVAVLPPTVSRAELEELSVQGIRGVRINLESAHNQNIEAAHAELSEWAQRIGPLGWHIQIYAALDVIAAVAPQMQRLQVPTVLDHFAMIQAATPLNDSRIALVLDLLEQGGSYVKLSAPYRISFAPSQDHLAITRLAQQLIAANPQRLLWGSDWPHTNREPGRTALQVSTYRAIDPNGLLSALDDWAPDPQVREQILVDNPARLYGSG